MYQKLYVLIGNEADTKDTIRVAKSCGITDVMKAFRIYLFDALFPNIGEESETWRVIDQALRSGITDLDTIRKVFL